MDLVEYSEEVFNNIVSDYEGFSSKLLIKDIRFIPISALEGDNVVNESQNMNWFKATRPLQLQKLKLEGANSKKNFRRCCCKVYPFKNILKLPQNGYPFLVTYAS